VPLRIRRHRTGSVGHKTLKSIVERVPEVLDRMGLTDRNLVACHLPPLLNANKKEFFANKGKVTDQRSVAAYNVGLHPTRLYSRNST
jgi:hypothetical protein